MTLENISKMRPGIRVLSVGIALPFLAAVLWILATHGPIPVGDDALFAHAMQTRNLFDELATRYMTWSGRVIVDGVTMLLVQHATWWRIGTTLCLLGLMYLVGRSTDSLANPWHVAFLCAMPFLIDRDVLFWAAWWVTGSFNYLWPLALGAFALVPFLRADTRSWWFLATAPAAVYAASQEQAGMLLVGLQTLASVHLLRTRALKPGHVVQWLVAALVMLSVVLAPGNRARYSVVVTYWFPEYLDLSLHERAFSGLDLALTHFFASGNAAAAMFVGVLAMAVFRANAQFVPRLLATVPIGVLLVPWLAGHLLEGTSLGKNLADTWAYQSLLGLPNEWPRRLTDDADAMNWRFYLHFFLVACGALCVAASLFNAGIRHRLAPPPMLAVLFGAAIASTAAVGLSPSLYASGVRLFFFQDFMVGALAVLVCTQLPDRIARCVAVVAVLLAAVGILNTVPMP